ncbi:MAG: hypothetical protein Q4G43_03940 [Mobilicoccus sp.]|nr:hypothetical protein [Mobilicoccus sp.]
MLMCFVRDEGYCVEPGQSWRDRDDHIWHIGPDGTVTDTGSRLGMELDPTPPTDRAALSAWIDDHATHPPTNELEDEGRFSFVTALLGFGGALSADQRRGLVDYAMTELDAVVIDGASDRMGREGTLLYRRVEGGDMTDDETQALLVGADGTTLEMWRADPIGVEPSTDSDDLGGLNMTLTILGERVVAELPKP